MVKTKEEQAEKFLTVISENYGSIKKKWRRHQVEKHRDFDDDVFSETIISIYDLIKRKGIQDDTDDGYLNYFFKAFNINTAREKQYAREAKKDKSQDVFDYLKYTIDDTNIEEIKKQEAYKQYVTYHTLKKAQEHFDEVTFRCFRIYYLYKGMTYEKVKNLTKVKDCKKRILEVRKFLQENLDKGELNKQFNEWYSLESSNFW